MNKLQIVGIITFLLGLLITIAASLVGEVGIVFRVGVNITFIGIILFAGMMLWSMYLKIFK